MTVSAKLTALHRGTRTFVGDVAEGFFEITHNGFALVGLTVVCAAAMLAARPDIRQQGEEQLAAWAMARQVAMNGFETDLGAIDRATAANPRDLPREQANVALWISKKYKVAPEPLAALVAEAYQVGQRVKLDPTLILAVMAVESSFNPFAQSPVGAQGLMQVMTHIHADKYQGFGGHFAAFDPVTNLRVGVQVLKECIARAGSIEGGLKHYVGAANLPTDGGYAAKVMAEHARLYQAAKGRPLPLPADADLRAATQTPARPAAPQAPSAEGIKVAAL